MTDSKYIIYQSRGTSVRKAQAYITEVARDFKPFITSETNDLHILRWLLEFFFKSHRGFEVGRRFANLTSEVPLRDIFQSKTVLSKTKHLVYFLPVLP